MRTTLRPMPDRTLTLADTMNQLKAEIGDRFGGNKTAFAKAAGINRSQLEGYLAGERDMGLQRLFACIAAVEVSPEEFFRRARERARQSMGDPTE